ncbi:MAG TPA: DUF1003 domain-containing protein [Candidatus Izemoplasmatales bacterium]|nr:DUF1003 domain-containing protein [Candidatus Izemoplasmatales bacterium]
MKDDKIDLIQKLLRKNELKAVENDEQAMHAILEKKISENINTLHEGRLTVGQKVSDKVADWAGSWAFIISFVAILIAWIVINGIFLASGAFDPYPFILLNLILSCVAALQAPIIMMSQNRQDAKDRLRSENDYKVNLKAEIILEDLHKKIDTLLINQNDLKKQIAELKKTGNKTTDRK